MPAPKKKLVKVDDYVVAFPPSFTDEKIAAIIEKFKESLSTEKPQTTKYKYGNTQADIPPDSEAGKALAQARTQIDKNDLMPSANTTDGGGLEQNSHITVRYGIDGEDTEGIKAYLSKQAPFTATLGKTTAFPPSEHSDGGAPIVVAIDSPELHRMEKEIDQHGNFVERSFPEYKPHITLAYVKPDAAEKYVGSTDLSGKKFMVRSVSISKRDGTIEEVQLKGKAPNIEEVKKAAAKLRPVGVQ
jgi:2'-5' RNA ligase